jgi:hypothetical protein
MEKPIRFFLLAHPDDELFALPVLFDSRFKNFLFFLTVGEFDARYEESRKCVGYLRGLGLEIDLLANPHPCHDGHVDSKYSITRFQDLMNLVSRISPNELVTSFYEGGHQDHDSAAVLGYLLSIEMKIPLLMFSTYRKSNNIFIPFLVMPPLEKASIFSFDRVAVVRAFVSLLNIYRSQRKTWIGLGVFVLFRYLKGKTSSFKLATTRIDLELSEAFYESRNRAKLFHVKSNHQKLIDKVIGG